MLGAGRHSDDPVRDQGHGPGLRLRSAVDKVDQWNAFRPRHLTRCQMRKVLVVLRGDGAMLMARIAGARRGIRPAVSASRRRAPARRSDALDIGNRRLHLHDRIRRNVPGAAAAGPIARGDGCCGRRPVESALAFSIAERDDAFSVIQTCSADPPAVDVEVVDFGPGRPSVLIRRGAPPLDSSTSRVGSGKCHWRAARNVCAAVPLLEPRTSSRKVVV